MASLLVGQHKQPSALLAAVARVRSAAAGFLAAGSPDALPLGEFHADELRTAALRVLALLDPSDAAAAAALEVEQARRVDHAVAALAAIDLGEVRGAEREHLAVAVSAVYEHFLGIADDDVTRALLDSASAGPALAALVFDCDPSLLGPDAQVSYCQAAQRLESAAHARLSAGLVAFAGSNPRNTSYFVDGDEYQLTDVRASELASALSWSGNKARSAVESARVMSTELEAAAEAATTGLLQPAALTAITEGARLLTSTIDAEIDQARQALRSDTDSTDDISDRLWELTSARQELVERYDEAVSAFASSHTLAETKRKVRDTLAKLDPEGFEARRAKAREVQSGVEFRGLPDAMAMISAVMPAEHASACYRAIDVIACDPQQSDPALPVGVRRSDALLALCARTAAPLDDAGCVAGGSLLPSVLGAGRPTVEGACADACLSGSADACLNGSADACLIGSADACLNGSADGRVCDHGDGCTKGHACVDADAQSTTRRTPLGSGARRNGTTQLGAHVDLVMTLDAFLGISETPAECVGAGPIPASAARALLADAALVSIRRVLVDDLTGHALDVGVRRYSLTEAERDYILARDRVCRRPGCNQPARKCETDHVVPYVEGGPSRTDNLGALCVRHHQEKTHGGWSIEASRADGSCTFVSPLGRRYEHTAEPVLPWAVGDPPPLHTTEH